MSSDTTNSIYDVMKRNRSNIPVFEIQIPPRIHKQNISRMPCNEIIPRLFLGDESIINNSEFIRSNNIKLVINCAREITTPIGSPSISLKYFHYILDDNSDTDDSVLTEYILDAIEHIRTSLLKEEGVLVHCRMGVSRSATFVIAYLMKYGIDIKNPEPMNRNMAFDLVKSKRSHISPNIGFCVWLRKFRPDPDIENDDNYIAI